EKPTPRQSAKPFPTVPQVWAKPLVRQSARQSISTLGLDSILYLSGFSDKDLQILNQDKS
ncbi:hypothetical protein, partial [Endozoicomonas sp. SESOKO2]|uniref:hypothetical protein n=1 Tax=Endozoicomonas sp. SESOKO2 TaxID=2828743 RepID=UPI00214929CD